MRARYAISPSACVLRDACRVRMQCTALRAVISRISNGGPSVRHNIRLSAPLRTAAPLSPNCPNSEAYRSYGESRYENSLCQFLFILRCIVSIKACGPYCNTATWSGARIISQAAILVTLTSKLSLHSSFDTGRFRFSNAPFCYRAMQLCQNWPERRNLSADEQKKKRGKEKKGKRERERERNEHARSRAYRARIFRPPRRTFALRDTRAREYLSSKFYATYQRHVTPAVHFAEQRNAAAEPVRS